MLYYNLSRKILQYQWYRVALICCLNIDISSLRMEVVKQSLFIRKIHAKLMLIS